MSVGTSIAELVEVLGDARLMPRAQFDELVFHLLPTCNDWSILCRECVYRGWLTPFQAKRLLQGRGKELIVGSYILLESLGEGGMGRVYHARNWKLGTSAALKVIRRQRASDPTAVERFLREVRALAAMRHPNVVYALDADVEEGRLYFAMEYVVGVDLGKLLEERGALPIETACRYAAQLAEGLWHISSLGMVHRDVKPGNILVTEDGSAVKLADLGLARFDHPDWEAAASDLTQVGMMIGTPDYIAPEQIRDSRRADIRSDLYSLGCTFYHMLTGQAPFDNSPLRDKLYLHQNSDPTPVEELRPDVPIGVAEVVRKLLAKKPRDRYQDPGELVAQLRPYRHSMFDTVTDEGAPTTPGLPVPLPTLELPRTDEVPVLSFPTAMEESDNHEAFRERGPSRRWLTRWPWLIAAAITGVTMGVLIVRG